jgi:hypothetical protein
MRDWVQSQVLPKKKIKKEKRKEIQVRRYKAR